MLSPMRYKDYIWPHNPRSFEVEYSRALSKRKLPLSGFSVQDFGRSWRVFRGEGEFSGENAYAQFERLAELFSKGGAGLLVHPVWKSVWVVFSKLSLKQEPRADFVSYSFEFTEYGTAQKDAVDVAASEDRGGTYTVTQGDTLGSIAATRGLELSEILKMNPQIKNANLISCGDTINV